MHFDYRMDDVTLNHEIPFRTWVRLRGYAQHHDLTMPQATSQALDRGLDTIGVPQDAGVLLEAKEDQDV